jgi:hypothetical protein
MNRLSLLVGSGLLVLLVVRAVPVAAQPGGPCSLISDDALSQALGGPAHAQSLFSNAAPANTSGPVVSDMCYAQLGGQNVLVMMHMVGVQSPGDTNGVLGLTQGGAAAGLGGAVDPSTLAMAPISGVGDAAVLLTATRGADQYAQLIVWSGTDGFSFAATGLADPQTTLTDLAQAVLANRSS